MKDTLVMRNNVAATVIAMVFVATLFNGYALGDQRYAVTDLGSLGGDVVWPRSINNRGEVVGYSETLEGAKHAFLYRDGVMTDIGVRPGQTNSYANDINDDGHIVGYSPFSGGQRAFLYIDGEMIDLGLPSQHRYSVATAINNDGVIAGYAFPYSQQSRSDGFIYENGAWVALKRAGAGFTASVPRHINSSGLIAGYVGSGQGHAAIYTDNQWVVLGELGGRYANSRVEGMNDAGQVVGWSDAFDTLKHAFLYEDGVMHDLGVPSSSFTSSARDINSRGQIITRNRQEDILENHAFLYYEGEWTDLNTTIAPESGWLLEEPVAINDAGWITGRGKHNGVTRAFLLTPIPEPTTLALAAMGLMGIGCCRRRRATPFGLAA